MIYLDTHAIIWLAAGQLKKFSKTAVQLINNNHLFYSGIVKLEMQVLYEIKRIKLPAEELLTELNNTIGLSICQLSLSDIATQAIKLNWTRDPFDRLIVANAMLKAKPLLTIDETIHKHYKFAVW
jgi:PIN domain nuclease of toxin-antitoxin system